VLNGTPVFHWDHHNGGMSISKAAAKIADGRAAQQSQSAAEGAGKAPGKRHRKPPPQEAIDKRLGEPVGKQMGQKSFKVGKSRGRG
jgi:hypothetical protein